MARVDGSDDKNGVLYGLHAVREALRAGSRPLQRLLVLRTDGQFSDLVSLARAKSVPVHIEPRPAIDRMVPRGNHQGVVGIVAAKAYSEEDDILVFAKSQQQPLLLLLDGVEDPYNLGAVLRTSEAAGVHGVILPERRSVGLTALVAKASAGALDHMHVARVRNLSRTIERLQQEGMWVYGFAPASPKSYTVLDYRGPVALVLGGEGKGIRRGVLEKCDDTVHIPMCGHVASLNVSAAAAIALFEVVRQRRILCR
jgi:23S rRNA (guanosine2251-2'-O)-methyltransferase